MTIKPCRHREWQHQCTLSNNLSMMFFMVLHSLVHTITDRGRYLKNGKRAGAPVAHWVRQVPDNRNVPGWILAMHVIPLCVHTLVACLSLPIKVKREKSEISSQTTLGLSFLTIHIHLNTSKKKIRPIFFSVNLQHTLCPQVSKASYSWMVITGRVS